MTTAAGMGPCRRCGITHESWTARARCLMPDAGRPIGSGRWAAVHPLTLPTDHYPHPQAYLFGTRAEAESWVVSHDQGGGSAGGVEGCCGSCIRARQAGYRSAVVDLARITPWPKGQYRERPGITARRGLMG